MEFVLIALAVVVGIVALSWTLSRVVVANHVRKARAVLPPAGAMDVEEPAIGLTPPFKAWGMLRLTPSELVFADSKGGVLTIPRAAIDGCTASTDVPVGGGMRTMRQPALVVAVKDPTLEQGYGFVVNDATAWVERLRQRRRGR